MPKLTSLTQEEMDNVIYDARFGDLDSLKAIFTDEVEPSVLPKIKDEMTKATPFHMAAANGHADVLKYLITLLNPKETKFILNQQNDSGNTALHWAAYNGHLECVKLLSEYGSDPFIQNNFKHDIFFEAQNSKHDDIVKFLLETFGEELEARSEGDKNGQKVDPEKVQYSAGTEIQKVEEGGENEDEKHEDEKEVEFLNTKTENLRV